jgi:2-polyprenyl-3-methyl-5-hydroxy-6-metoxy-1,4-benzoquinol methylase
MSSVITRAVDRYRAEALLARLGPGGDLPTWPEEALQKRYTGKFGLPLLQQTLDFVDMLDAQGAFATPDWRGLDHGCGWGRIASVLLTRGRPDQLDLCDAWERSLALVRKAGFRNRIFLVSERLDERALGEQQYDFVYSYSIFTHLARPLVTPNILAIRNALRPGGTFFFTVRHEDFFDRVRSTPRDRAILARDGYWFRPHADKQVYGDAIFARSRIAELIGVDGLRYVGLADVAQHLYALSR